MDLFNPRILDASICDVVAKLSDIQKADVLLHALQHVPIKGCRTIIENAVQSLLQVPDLPSSNVARALLLRAKGRLATGYRTSAHQGMFPFTRYPEDIFQNLLQDLHSASIADPENEHVKATIQSQQVSTRSKPSSSEMVLQEADGPPHFPEEIWMQIALCLPRRDIRSLLLVPNAFSRIATQLLSREIDLHLTTGMEPGEGLGTFLPHNVPSNIVEDVDQGTVAQWHNQRSADLLTRILVDSHFARQIRSLNIFAVSSDVEPQLEFKAGMLVNALAKLSNVHKLHCSANRQFILRVVQSVHVYSPRLQHLSLVLAEPGVDIEVPIFRHLTHFSIRSNGGGDSSVQTFLDQSRDMLRCLSIKNPSWRFPTRAISVRHLARFEFTGSFLEEAISEILENGHHLESLMLSGVLQSSSSSLIRQHCDALPFLRQFSLTIIAAQSSDPEFCPAISDFLRERTQLQTYHLFVSETHAGRVGFDASAWAILPALSGLRNLSITFPKDLPPALAGWLIPRTVRALTLEFWRTDNRDATSLMIQLRKGMPHLLCYIGISDIRFRSPVRNIVEQGVPYVRVARVNGTIWTVTRSGEGPLEMEQWPRRRVQYRATEWLESLGCRDAIWRGVDD